MARSRRSTPSRVRTVCSRLGCAERQTTRFWRRSSTTSSRSSTLLEGLADLARRPDGTIVVATSHGGRAGGGQLIAIGAGGTASTMADFSMGHSDGWYPDGTMVRDADGALYGTIARGGAFDAGTIFRVSRSGQFQTLYTFTGRGDGQRPRGLVQLANGAIFGSPSAGDTHTSTVFTVSRSGADDRRGVSARPRRLPSGAARRWPRRADVRSNVRRGRSSARLTRA